MSTTAHPSDTSNATTNDPSANGRDDDALSRGTHDTPLNDWADESQRRIDELRNWVRVNPMPAIGVALFAGFIIGRMIRR